MANEVLKDEAFYRLEEQTFRGWWVLDVTPEQVRTLADCVLEELGERPAAVVFTAFETASFSVGDDGLFFTLKQCSPLVIAHELAHLLCNRWRLDEGPTGHNQNTWNALCLVAAVMEDML